MIILFGMYVLILTVSFSVRYIIVAFGEYV